MEALCRYTHILRVHAVRPLRNLKYKARPQRNRAFIFICVTR
jgi:hypothetical protein